MERLYKFQDASRHANMHGLSPGTAKLMNVLIHQIPSNQRNN